MKQSNVKHNFITSFKYWIIFPIVLTVLAIVLGAIFGLNLDYDFKKVDSFNVKFNTTVTSSEYEVLENEISNILDNYNIEDYRLERVGEGADNSVLVKIVSADYDLDTIKVDLKDNLLNNAGDDVTSEVVIFVTETITNLPRNVLSMTLYAALSVGCILLFGFIYNWIRFNLVAGYSSVLSQLFGITMLFAIQVVARIPFNTNYIIAYTLLVISSIILTTFINNSLKNTLTNPKFAKSTNAERVISVVKSSYLTYTIIYSIILVAVFVLGLLMNISALYTSLSIIAALIISFVTSMFFFTTIWSLTYNKDKDNVLIRRINLEQKRLEDKEKKVKTDEKIVV